MDSIPGLLSGNAGIALYLYGHKDNPNNLKVFNQIISHMPEALAEYFQYSYCVGVAGIGWLYQFINDEGYFKDDTNTLLEDFDLYLSTVLRELMKRNDTDFLHGATGIAYYFYSRCKDNPNAYNVLQEYVNAISKTVIKEQELLKLATKDFKANETIYNISLSHGMSSIVSILSRIYTIEALRTENLKHLIEGMVNYILSQEIDKDKYGSYFPYLALECSKSIYGSRLAWCYGDLGICTTIYQVGQIMNRQDWINKALEILSFSAIKRRSLEENLVRDACICHGAAGICQIFYRMWWNTRMKEFYDASDYWFNMTLSMSKFEDGFAGYKTWNRKDGYVNQSGILEGIAGIGLALTSYIQKTDPTWDECLLLS